MVLLKYQKSFIFVLALLLCSCGSVDEDEDNMIGSSATVQSSELGEITEPVPNELASPLSSGNSDESESSTNCGNEKACGAYTLVNQLRRENGKRALAINSNCLEAAQFHAEEMANKGYFSHTSQNGTSAGTRVRSFGGNYTGENIAMGQTSPGSVVKSWVSSSGHRANILSKISTTTGVGYALNHLGRPIWVQVFCN